MPTDDKSTWFGDMSSTETPEATSEEAATPAKAPRKRSTARRTSSTGARTGARKTGAKKTATRKAGAKKAVYLETNTVTITPIGSDAVLPGGSVQMRVQLVNNGAAKATAVTASLTSSSPYVHVTQPTSTYPTVNPGATATNPTPFAFDVDAATPCGATLPLTLTKQ